MGYESMDGIAFRMEAFGLWLALSIANAAHSRVLSNVSASARDWNFRAIQASKWRSNVTFGASVA